MELPEGISKESVLVKVLEQRMTDMRTLWSRTDHILAVYFAAVSLLIGWLSKSTDKPAETVICSVVILVLSYISLLFAREMKSNYLSKMKWLYLVEDALCLNKENCYASHAISDPNWQPQEHTYPPDDHPKDSEEDSKPNHQENANLENFPKASEEASNIKLNYRNNCQRIKEIWLHVQNVLCHFALPAYIAYRAFATNEYEKKRIPRSIKYAEVIPSVFFLLTVLYILLRLAFLLAHLFIGWFTL